MTKALAYAKRTFIGLLVLLQIAFYPSIALAQAAPDTSTEETPTSTQETTTEEEPAPEPEQQETPSADTPPPVTTPPAPTVYGPDRPNGAAGDTFKYNAATGLWENDYYVWDQATQSTKPKKAPVYTYNPATGLWESVQWIYQAHLGKYMPFTVTFNYNPSPVQTQNAAIANSGPNSANGVNASNTYNGTSNNYNTSGITNFLTATAFTGDATVYANTFGGNAKSGEALSAANILNLLQSSWAPHTATFEANIDGNVVGDLMIDTSGPNSSNNINVDNTTNLTTNIETDSEITNNVDLVAESGDATVEANTHGGNATTGSATAIVNIINMLNSMISTGQSFVGTININGDFEGDILLPQDMLEYLIAHSGPGSSNSVNSNDESTLDVNVSDTQIINNNVNATAESGDANVTGNTSAGSATSGSATTNVTILNLTGKQIIADNAVLVFINVHGTWIGAIVNAPEGSTAAAIGGGPGSVNNVSQNNNLNQDVNVTSTTTINNNVNVEASTGDATVKDNTFAGDATSGDASASVNIANITGSDLKLRKWFGVLFINVFGSWKGSFGVNTAYGNQPAVGGMGGGAVAGANTAMQARAQTRPTFAFIPRAAAATSDSTQTSSASTSTPSGTLASTSTETEQPAVAAAASTNPRAANFWWAVGGVSVAMGLLGLERFLTFRKRA